MIGVNGRLDEVQAAVLRIKLRNLDEWLENRRNLAEHFNAKLSGKYIIPEEIPWAKHVYHLYVIRTPERDRLREWLIEKGIGVGMHYPIPVHLQEAWRSCGGEDLYLPVTEKITQEILSLPMYPELTFDEVDYICSCVKEFNENKPGVKVDG